MCVFTLLYTKDYCLTQHNSDNKYILRIQILYIYIYKQININTNSHITGSRLICTQKKKNSINPMVSHATHREIIIERVYCGNCSVMCFGSWKWTCHEI